jgi:WD40 repeat protein
LGSSLLFLSRATALTRLSLEEGTAIEFFADHSAPITDFGFSSDGRIIYSAGEDHVLRLWAAERGEELGSIQGGKSTWYLSSRDARRIAAGTDSEVELWDIESGRRLLHQKDIGRFIGGGDPCFFTPDGRRLIVANVFVSDPDSLRFDTKIFDAADGREMASLGGAAIDMSPERYASGRHSYRGVTGVAISPNSCFLALSNDCLTLWEMEEKRMVAGLYGLLGMVPVGAIDFSPDGRTFVVADTLGQVLLFSIENIT